MSIGLTNPKISIKLYTKSKRFDDEEDKYMMKVAQRGFWLVGGSCMEIIEPTLEFRMKSVAYAWR